MSTNMRHLEFIDKIASTDCDTLRRKEKTYQGSWKKRGGVGAFMMLARKWDRLENMLSDSDPEETFRAWDIFWIIQENMSGSDGTALAEIRDLRQYLLLVEAEMQSRIPVTQAARLAEDAKVVQTHDQLKERASGTVTDATQAEERRVPRFDTPSCGDGLADSHARQRAPEPLSYTVAAAALEERAQRTADDGAQHENVAPWIVGSGYFERKDVPVVMRSRFWNQRAAGTHVLEPHVVSDQIPRVLRSFYNMRGGTWTLRVEQCPRDARDFFPSLTKELNMKEHEELPEWQRALYTWDTDGNKYRLAHHNWSWHAEDEA